jgi:hypothetical protein
MAAFGVVMIKKIFAIIIMTLSLGLASATLLPTDTAYAGCDDSFLGFPSWCRNLKMDGDGVKAPCTTDVDRNSKEYEKLCKDKDSLTVFIWKIILNISDILFRLAGMIAVGFVMYAGFTYLTSQGQADKISNAKKTLQNALIGLVIAILATAIINTVMGVIS